jgi:hypothetical protein
MAVNQGRTRSKLDPQAPGTTPDIFSGLFSEQVISNLLPSYAELSRRGLIYTISTPQAGVTIAAANVSPLAAGTGQPIVGCWNPTSSDTLILVLKIWFATRSGTPGGPLVWNTISKPTFTTPTTVNAVNHRTLQAAGCSGRYFANGAMTGGQAATFLRPIFANTPVAAGAAFQGNMESFTDGAIPIFPDSFWGIAATAAGTTHLVDGYIEVAELPLGLTA